MIDGQMTDLETQAAINWSDLSVAPSSVSEELATRLERMIRDGQLPAGSRLPPERELQRLLGVSRVSIREALHDLELKGMIDRRPGRGTIVVASESAAQVGTLLARLNERDRTLLEIMDFRAAIEPPIAARAAARATARDVRALHEIVTGMERAADSEHKALDEAFHAAVARAAHSSLFVKLLDITADWLSTTRHITLQSPRRWQASLAAHRKIAAAIAAHDAERGAAAMAEHIDNVNRLLAEQLPEDARRLGRPWVKDAS